MFVSTKVGLLEHITGTWVKAQALDITEQTARDHLEKDTYLEVFLHISLKDETKIQTWILGRCFKNALLSSLWGHVIYIPKDNIPGLFSLLLWRRMCSQQKVKNFVSFLGVEIKWAGGNLYNLRFRVEEFLSCGLANLHKAVHLPLIIPSRTGIFRARRNDAVLVLCKNSSFPISEMCLLSG